MMTVIQLFKEDGTLLGYRVICKGASEIILGKCSYFIGLKGDPELFTTEWTGRLKGVIENMAQNGLRTICVGYKDYILRSVREPAETECGIDSEEDIDWEDEHSVACKFIGLVICGIQDPVRDEVPEAIQKCRRAGITVRMVTGDNVNTARAIALQCRILEPGYPF